VIMIAPPAPRDHSGDDRPGGKDMGQDVNFPDALPFLVD